MLIDAKKCFEIEKLQVQLSEEFEMKNFAVGKKILRMKIQRNRKQGNYFLLRRSMLRESSNVLL